MVCWAWTVWPVRERNNAGKMNWQNLFISRLYLSGKKKSGFRFVWQASKCIRFYGLAGGKGNPSESGQSGDQIVRYVAVHVREPKIAAGITIC